MDNLVTQSSPLKSRTNLDDVVQEVELVDGRRRRRRRRRRTLADEADVLKRREETLHFYDSKVFRICIGEVRHPGLINS